MRRPDGPMTETLAPSAISTGGRSIWGSACARCPPTVATLRTRTFDKVRNVRAITGACSITIGECSRLESELSAPICSAPSAPMRLHANAGSTRMQAYEPGRLEHAGLHHEHQRRAACYRPHRRFIGIQQRDSLAQGAWPCNLEWRHGMSPIVPGSSAARK